MASLICGSIAYDTIMNFEGKFADQILENIAKLSEMAIEAAKNGAKLIVMPEETIDYLAFNRQMGLKIAETFP